jgi:hypothetical protein
MIVQEIDFLRKFFLQLFLVEQRSSKFSVLLEILAPFFLPKFSRALSLSLSLSLPIVTTLPRCYRSRPNWSSALWGRFFDI